MDKQIWIVIFLGLSLCVLKGVGLKCFVCDTTSAQSYADANQQCNSQHKEQECEDPRSTACMLEGYMQPNNVAQVVKKCMLKCPVFINTTAEVVRCCPKDGCNGELEHRPPPPRDRADLRGRPQFPPHLLPRDRSAQPEFEHLPGDERPPFLPPGFAPDERPSEMDMATKDMPDHMSPKKPNDVMDSKPDKTMRPKHDMPMKDAGSPPPGGNKKVVMDDKREAKVMKKKSPNSKATKTDELSGGSSAVALSVSCLLFALFTRIM